jgi:stress response protein YsnF
MTEAEEVAAIPLVEERLEVGKRQVESGRVRVRVAVDTREETVPAELAHDEVEVRRVPRNLAVSDLPSLAATLRRTEVDVERLEPEAASESGGAGDAPGRGASGSH